MGLGFRVRNGATKRKNAKTCGDSEHFPLILGKLRNTSTTTVIGLRY